jgi:reactive intermediate/imine deaminase
MSPSSDATGHDARDSTSWPGVADSPAERRPARARREEVAMAPIFHRPAAAPRPVAPFSHAVECDGWVWLTGQMPTDPHAPDAPPPPGVEAQTRRVMDNLGIVLDALGLGFADVVQCRVYLTDFAADYAAMNAVYASYFAPDRLPARTCVGVTALAVGARVEIDLVARRP